MKAQVWNVGARLKIYENEWAVVAYFFAESEEELKRVVDEFVLYVLEES